MPIPDPNKPEQHEGWCPLGETNLSRLLSKFHFSQSTLYDCTDYSCVEQKLKLCTSTRVKDIKN